MRTTVYTEKELAEANLWPKGEYDCEVIDAIEETSKSGNDMVHLKLRVHNEDGGTILVDDYLVDTPRTAYKVRHCAEALGLLQQYERGELPREAFLGRNGKCKLAVQSDKNGQYPDKNTVSDYVKSASGAPRPASPTRARTPAPAGDIDDEIPF